VGPSLDDRDEGTADLDPAARVQLLTEEVARLTRERDLARAALETFVYAASHDLGEPVRKVTAFGGLLRRRCGDELSETGLRYLDFMTVAAGRMGAQLDALLEWSRVGTRGRPFEPVALDRPARAAEASLRERLEQRGGRVEIGELAVAHGDPRQLRQLLRHLLDNALTFSHPDRAPVIQVRASRQGDRVLLEVEDNGIGFGPDDAETIFEPFRRLHGLKEGAGVGMGLAICSRIAERHGARLWAVGRPGVGAIFTLELSAGEPGEGA